MAYKVQRQRRSANRERARHRLDGAEATTKLFAMAQRCGVRLDDEEIMSCMHIVAEHVGVPVMEELQNIDDQYFDCGALGAPGPEGDVFFAWLPGDGFLTMNERCLTAPWNALGDLWTGRRRTGTSARTRGSSTAGTSGAAATRTGVALRLF